MKPLVAFLVFVSLGCAQAVPHARITQVEPVAMPDIDIHPSPAAPKSNQMDASTRHQNECQTTTDLGLASYSSAQPSASAAPSKVFPEFENIASDANWHSFSSSLDSTTASITSSSNQQWLTVLDEPSGAPKAILLNDGPTVGDLNPDSLAPHFTLFDTLLADERNFYSCGSLTWLGIGVGTSAIFANTSLDEDLRRAVSGPNSGQSTDMNWAKAFGSGQYVIPALAGVFVVDYLVDYYGAPGEHPIAGWLEEWSGRSLRSLTVGALPLITLQYAIGSSRPGESSAGSRWDPFQDNNGVSGHAFIGAIPFWTAAQLTENVPLQIGLYGMGTLAGISRIHTDSHYFSQVLMGWWIAGLSVAAVNQTEWEKHNWQFGPALIDGAPGIAVMHQW